MQDWNRPEEPSKEPDPAASTPGLQPKYPPLPTHPPYLIADQEGPGAPQLPNNPTNGSPNTPPNNSSTNPRKRLYLLGALILAALIVVALVIWGIAALTSGGGNTEPNTNAPLSSDASSPSPSGTPSPTTTASAQTVSPLDLTLGQCFKDYDPQASETTVVDCKTPHSAQLVGVFFYEDKAEYPGTTELRSKGRELCGGVNMNSEANNFTLKQNNVYPSEGSWSKGDRRVDCFASVDTGNALTSSLLAK
ncbi:septum formation family protein [Pseudarthrobacter sp. J1738]|uniref:septum formation family protein n=1 Tax=unclassified Pseudarthrobacter TaxID=2647000 RepID=UPI003D2899B8